MRKTHHIKFHRGMALLLVLCLMLSAVNAGLLFSYASEPETVYQIGDSVTATLLDTGVLLVSGTGDTYHYQNEDDARAPFYEERQLITGVELEAGITSIGDYLFYNCENLSGTLSLPETVIKMGDYAFSGDSKELAPKFHTVINEFTGTEVVIEREAASGGGPGDAEELPPAEEPQRPEAANPLPEGTEEPAPDAAGDEPADGTPAGSAEPAAPENGNSGGGEADEPDAGVESTPETAPDQAQAGAEPDGEADGRTGEAPSGHDADADGGVEDARLGDKAVDAVETLVSTVLSPFTVTAYAAETESGPVPEQPGGEPSSEQPGGVSIPVDDGKPRYDTEWITQQELGAEIFFPGQTGVFECRESQNQSFTAAMEDAGYTEILSWTAVSFADGFKNSVEHLIPVTELGAFLPGFAETGLALPKDAQTAYHFLGWEAGGDVLEPHSFHELPEGGLTALWKSLPRALIPQTITKAVGTQVVEISGNLPEGAEVSAEKVELTNELLGLVSQAVGSDAPEIFFALDITILVDGAKYQPNEYGESVTVHIRNVENLPTEAVSVLHLSENEQTRRMDLVETLTPRSLLENSVAFTADSFSIYVGAGSAAQTEITFDLAKGPVTLGENYSGRDEAGNLVTGAHKPDNYYIVTQSNAGTPTENDISFEGDGLTFQVELAGIYVQKAFQAGDGSDAERKSNSSIFIPAGQNQVKHVTLYLRNKNILDNICYFSLAGDMQTGANASASTLTITSAEGDGSPAGVLKADATARPRYTAIGGTGSYSVVTGLTIAGGTIEAACSTNEAAIGSGSNGYADITITGGQITARQNGNAPAIGSGGGEGSPGGNAEITISGGTVTASNVYADAPAIGAGGSTSSSAGNAEITISGGTVTATAENAGAAISGGYSGTTGSGSYADADIRITGGSVSAVMGETPTSDGATAVKLTTVTLQRNDTPQPDLAVDSLTVSSGASYGTADMKTDGEGKLYLWLPETATVTAAKTGIYAYSGSVTGGGIGVLTSSVLTFDLAKGPVKLGAEYSGTDSAGNPVTGQHKPENYYIVTQSDAGTPTTNTVTFDGNDLTFQVVLDGVNVDRVFSNKENDNNRDVDSSIYIPAYPGQRKHVTLYLRGDSKLNNICYYTINGDSVGNGNGAADSTLTITSAAGDGSLDGTLTIDATQKLRYSCIGATGDKSTATGLTIAGGTITAVNSGAEAAIGGGSNGYADITITGGQITAKQNGNAPAIGSGSGTVAVGADAKIRITGGAIAAENINADGVAIGAGGSRDRVGGYAKIAITGGQITATVAGGTAIGGGNSTYAAGGGAEVAVSGGTLSSNGAIGGGFSKTKGYADSAIIVTGGSLNTMMSETPTNENGSSVYLTSATLYNADQLVTKASVTSISVTGYGMNDVRTDGGGTLYLWLPENAVLTEAVVSGNPYTGSILAKYAGILKYNSAKNYYSVHFPYDDRLTVYADEGRTAVISGSLTVPAGDVLSFWVDAGAYTVTAYRSAGTEMIPLAGAQSNGLYAYSLTVTSNTELLFVTQRGNETPRLSLDISTVSAIIDTDSVTVGGYRLPGYTGGFLLTSGALPTVHMLTVIGGSHNMRIDRLVAQRGGNVIEVAGGGTLAVTVSSFNNSLASTGYSAILVREGAELDLSFSGATDSLTVSSSETSYSPIGGAGIVRISQSGGFLNLASGGSAQITAERYTYTTNSLNNSALPYTFQPARGQLAGYHNGTKLAAPEEVYSISAATDFTACVIGYVLPAGVSLPAHGVTDAGALSVALPAETSVQSVKRNGEPLGPGGYAAGSSALTINASEAYGNLEIALKSETNKISYKAADYSAEYTGNPHTFTVSVAYPESAAVRYREEGGASYSESPPARTDAGVTTIFWEITAEGFEPVTGTNTLTVTKGTNQWVSELTCASIQYGSTPSPNAAAKWGQVRYSYYAAEDLTNSLGTVPTEAGSYYVKAAVEGTGNYDALESDFVPFTIETTVIYSTEGRVLERLSARGDVPISTNVTAAANGAFTVSYGFHYIPNSTNTPLTLNFSSPLPGGTKLTMLDLCLSHQEAPRFFYYIVPDSGISALQSTDFYIMGTSEHGTFENANADTAREVQYQLCVEFPQNASATEEFTIKLIQGEKELPKTEVTVQRTEPVRMGGSVSLSNAAGGERQLSVTAKISGAGGGRDVLTATLLDSTGKAVSFPAGAAVALEDAKPSVVRGSFAAFSGIRDGSLRMTVTGLPAGDYQLQVDLCADPKMPAYPLADSVSKHTTGVLTVTAPAYAVRAELTDGQSRVVNGVEGKQLSFRVTCSGGGAPAVISQRKEENGTYVDLAVQWNYNVNGGTAGDRATAAVTVPAETAPGTYRLVFTLGEARFPYNLIVE